MSRISVLIACIVLLMSGLADQASARRGGGEFRGRGSRGGIAWRGGRGWRGGRMAWRGSRGWRGRGRGWWGYWPWGGAAAGFAAPYYYSSYDPYFYYDGCP